MLNFVFRNSMLRAVCILLLISVFFISCASKILQSVEKTDNPTLKMVIARSMISQTRYILAKKILAKIKDEHPNDVALHIEIDYENAYISFNKKKYINAKNEFEKIINTYDSDTNNALPKWPFYLSKKLIEKNINPILEKRAARKTKKSKDAKN